MPRSKEDIRAYQKEYKKRMRDACGKLPSRKRDARIVLDKNILENLYIKENKTLYEVSAILKVSTATITRFIKKYNIPPKNELPIEAKSKFGKLTVISGPFEKSGRNGYYNCECECKERLVFRGDTLKNKKRQSCKKCAINDCIKFCGRITRQYWIQIMEGAFRRHIEFTITPEYIDSIFTGFCESSGLPIGFANSAYGHWKGENTASLDRIDSNKGYIPGNVRWIHKNINWMKSDFSEEEFIQYCCLVADKSREL